MDAIAKLENGAFVLSDLPWASSFAQVQEILGTQQDQWAVMENTSDGMVTTTVRRTVPVSVSQPEVSLMEEYRFANDQLYSRRLMLFVAKQGMEQTQQGQGQPIVFGGVSYSAPLAPEDQWEDICDTLAQQVQQAYGDPNSGTVEDIRQRVAYGGDLVGQRSEPGEHYVYKHFPANAQAHRHHCHQHQFSAPARGRAFGLTV